MLGILPVAEGKSLLSSEPVRNEGSSGTHRPPYKPPPFLQHFSSSGAAGEFLLLGTTSGDCLVSCVNAGGSPLFRFPAFKSQPLQHLALDLDRCARGRLASYRAYHTRCMIAEGRVEEGREVEGKKAEMR